MEILSFPFFLNLILGNKGKDKIFVAISTERFLMVIIKENLIFSFFPKAAERFALIFSIYFRIDVAHINFIISIGIGIIHLMR